MKHYSEADLLETYYTAPGESMPVMLHLAACIDCSTRYEGLEKKLREAAGDYHADTRPATFWSRQRQGVMRSIEVRQHQARQFRRLSRIAAAAVLSFVLGGTVVYETVAPSAPAKSPVQVTATEPAAGLQLAAPHDRSAEELKAAHDAWQSDELSDFHAVVEWESWENEKNTKQGGSSL